MFRALHPEVNHFTLDELVERYGISNEGRHTAAGDAVMTAKLFIALLEEAARTRKLYTLAQLTYTLYWRSMFTGQQR